jgi:hypothetical protein
MGPNKGRSVTSTDFCLKGSAKDTQTDGKSVANVAAQSKFLVAERVTWTEEIINNNL